MHHLEMAMQLGKSINIHLAEERLRIKEAAGTRNSETILARYDLEEEKQVLAMTSFQIT